MTTVTITGAGTTTGTTFNFSASTETAVNAGTVGNTGSNAGVLMTGSNDVLSNSGKILGGYIETGPNGAVIVQSGAGNSITNLSGGIILGSGSFTAGIYFVTAGSLTNSGSIASGGGPPGNSANGVLFAAGGAVTNMSGGTISGGGVYAKGASATVINSGVIDGDSAYGGVDLIDGGLVTNLAGGVISSGGGAYGIQVTGGAGTVTNAGTITAGSAGGSAVVLGAGVTNRVIVDPGAVFVGTVHGGTPADATLEFASAASAGIITNLGIFSNFGSMTFDAGASWTVTAASNGFTVPMTGFGSTDTIVVTGFVAVSETFVSNSVVLTNAATAHATIAAQGAFTTASFHISNNGTNTTLTEGATLVPPVISGAVAGQTTTDEATLHPFSGVSITDANTGQTETATITLSNTANGALSNPGSGTITAGTFSVAGSVAAVTTAIDALIFTPTAHQVAPGSSVTTTFTIQTTDTAAETASNSTTTVGATAVHDAPTIATAGTVSFTGGGSAVVLDPTATVSDPDFGATIAGATIFVSSGFLLGDTLNFTNQNGITGSFIGSTGTLTLSGATTATNYQTALDSITYSFTPADGDPTKGGADTARTVSWSVTDGTDVSSTGTSTVHTALPATIVYGRTIDETGIIAASETVTAGVMTLMNGGGTTVGSITVGTSLSSGEFTLKSDGGGGTDVIENTVFGTYASGVTLLTNPTTVGLTGHVSDAVSASGAVYGPAGTTWTLSNLATITSTGSNGLAVRLNAGGTVTNSGLISGISTAAGIYVGGAGGVTNLSSGTITSGSRFGIRITGAGNVTNNGTIQTGGTGITGNQAMTVINTGVILGTSGGSDGVNLQNGGSITNSALGTIIAGQYGIAIDTAAGTVTNSGTIEGTSGHGVYLYGGTVVNSGLITGAGGLSAVYLYGASTLINQAGGRITGGVGVTFSAANNTISNAGTITGNTGYAILFGNGDSRLIDVPGGVINGTVVGGGGIAVVELASAASAGTLSGFGGLVKNFTSLVFDAGAAWTVTGNDSAAGLGTLGISGFGIGDTIDLTGFAATSRTFASNSLVLTNVSNAHATLAIQGAFATGDFHIVSDGDGGTDITEQSVLVYGQTIVETGIVATTETVTAGVMTLENAGGTVVGTIAVGTSLNSGDFSLAANGGNTNVVVHTATGTYANGLTLLVNPSTIGSTASIGDTVASGAAVLGSSGTAWTLVNKGTVSATGTASEGVSLTSGGTVTNAASASIAGGLAGVFINGGAGSVSNSGGIAGTGTSGFGIRFGATSSGASVTNQAGGVITGTADAIYVNTGAGAGTVSNYGTIIGTAGFGGINLSGGGSVTNASGGTISGNQVGVFIENGAEAAVSNAGRIGGTQSYGIWLLNAGSVTNASGGNITGGYTTTSAASVYLGDGGSVTNQSGGTIGGLRAVYVVGAAATVVNAGQLVGGYTTIGAGAAETGAGVYVAAGGSVTNQTSGKISGYLGVYGRNVAATVINAGVIAGNLTGSAGAGVDLFAGGSVTNQAGGTITGYYGVNAEGAAATVINAGIVAGNYTSNYQHADGVWLQLGGTVTNQAGGAIYGRNDGVLITGARGTVVNLGSIHSHGGDYGGQGVSLDAGGLIVNGTVGGTASTAVIAGYNYAVQFGSSGTDTLVNYGTVSGLPGTVAIYMASGTIINGPSGATGALIEGGGQNNAVLIGGAATVANYGSITGSEYYSDTAIFFGIRLGGSGSIVSRISNLGSNSLITNYVAVYAEQNATVTNAGTMAAAIEHGGSATNAVIFGGGTNRLIVDPGAVFIGDVSGGGPVTLTPTIGSTTVLGTAFGTGVTTLELASGASAGLIDGLGTQYDNFASLVFDPGSRWSVSGNDSASGLGTLGIGGFTLGDTIDLTGFVAATRTYSTGSLVLTNAGGTRASLAIQGTSFATGDFLLAGDGHGGTDITILGDIAYGETIDATGTIANSETVGGGVLTLFESGGSVGTIVVGTSVSTGNFILRPDGVTGTDVIENVVFGTYAAGVTLLTNPTTIAATASVSGSVAAAGIFGSSGTNWTVTNLGTVVQTASLSAGISLAGAGTVINTSGKIAGAYTGVLINSTGAVTNQSGASISGITGINLQGTSGKVVNAGAVYGQTQAVLMDDGGSVTNLSGGTITGGIGVYVVNATATVTNSGVIAGNTATGKGIRFKAGGVLTNNAGGTIRGFEGVDATAASATVINAGGIVGASTSGFGVYLRFGGAVTNQTGGSISGGADAVKFAASHVNKMVIDPGATFTGNVDGGNTIGAATVSTLELASGGSTGTLSGIGSEYVHFANILIDSGAAWSLASGSLIAGYTIQNSGILTNVATIASAVTLVSGATLTNASGGTISSAGTGVFSAAIGPVTVVNSGLLRGATIGVSLGKGGAVTNNLGATITGAQGIYVGTGGTAAVVNGGTISGTTTNGVYLHAGGTVTNLATGQISGGTDSVRFNAGFVNRLVFTPGATFVGTADGGNTIGAATVSTLELASAASAGTLSGLGTGFVHFGSILVDAGATWSVSSGGIATGYTITDDGTLTNAASIGSAITLNNGAELSNASAGRIIVTTGTAIVGASGAAVAVVNAGAIYGSLAGIGLLGGGAVTNMAAGSITGRDGIYASGASATVANFGDIGGNTTIGFGVELAGGGTVTNASTGTIAGGAGAVSFAAGHTNRLVFVPGASFSGLVDGGNTIGAPSISTLELTSGAFGGTLSGLGSQFINFAQTTIDSNAYWTLSGTNSLVAGATIGNLGTLTDTGTLTDSGIISGHRLNLNGGALTVGTGGSVAAAYVYGVAAGGTDTVVNLGSIANSAVNAIYLATAGTVSNAATGLISGGSGVKIKGTAAALTNLGRIVGTSTDPGGYGVYMRDGGPVINGQSGVSTASIAGYVGVLFQTADIINAQGTLFNYGTIVGNGTETSGALLANAGAVFNGRSGATAALIRGGLYGVNDGQGTVVNYATISATNNGGGYGVVIQDTGAVSNLGTRALIEGYGGVKIGTDGTIVNSGTIESDQGTAGVAIEFTDGDARLIDDPGAVFIGSIFGGSGGTAVMELASAASVGTIAGFGTSITNFTSLVFDPNARWTVMGDDAANGLGTLGVTGFTIGDTIDLTGFAATGQAFANNALVLTDSVGDHATLAIQGSYSLNHFVIAGDGGGGTDITEQAGLVYGETIDVAGTVATSEAVSAGTLTLFNGGGTAVGTIAVGTSLSSGDFTVRSDGSGGTDVIVSTVFGTYANGVTLLTVPTTIAGSASVGGTANGVVGVYGPAGTAWDLTNQSFIDGAHNGDYAIKFAGGGTITNAASGAIYGYSYGIRINGGPEAVTNLGRIEYGVHNGGIFLQGGGSVINGAATSGSSAAYISGHYVGVRFSYAGNDTVTNYGTILSPAGQAVTMVSGSVVNGPGGATNALIKGVVGITFSGTSGTVTNFGTIASNEGTAGTAVYFSPGTNRLIDEPGAVFIGSINGGTGGTSVVELASGSSAGTISGFGTSITNFDSLVFDDGAAWTVTGNASPNGLGTVAISGFTAGDTIDLTGFAAVSRTFASGALVLTDAGGAHETLALAGTFATGNVAISSYGTGGTGISLQPFLIYAETIDETGILATTETVTAGSMTLENAGGTVVGTIAVGNSLASGDFSLAPDGAGGTDVIVHTASGTYANTLTLLVNPSTIGAAALISGTSVGAAGVGGPSGTAWTLVNRGTVTETGANSYGVSLTSGGAVTNAASGSIGGRLTGIVVNGAAGSISNAGGIGGNITAGTGILFNSGGSVTNQSGGTISGYIGVKGVTDAVTVVNAGAITGNSTTGFAVSLAGGGSVTNQAGGTISAEYGVIASYVAATVVNTGSIGDGPLATTGRGIELRDGGAVTNLTGGRIVAGRYGIYIHGAAGTVVNAGSIIGNSTSGNGLVLIAGGRVSNQAGGTISGFFGVYAVSHPATVVNQGGISGNLGYGTGVRLATGGALTNQSGGTITGLTGVFMQGGTVVNAASIGGSTATIAGAGVQLNGGAALSNQAGGTITGSHAVLNQSGTAYVTNAGLLLGSIFGVDLSTGTVVNSATIMATSTSGPGYGVYVMAGGSVSNAGPGSLIEGYTGLWARGGGTVTTAGTIASNLGSAGTALAFGTGAASLIVDPGAVFIGSVSGGTGTAVMELASAASMGAMSGFGTSITNFTSLVFDPGAAWTVTGNDSANGLGALAISGFTFGDTIDLTGFTAVSRTFLSNALVLTDAGGDRATLAIQSTLATGSFQIGTVAGGTGITQVVYLPYGETIDEAGIIVTSETVTGGTMTMFDSLTPVGTLAVGSTLGSGDFLLRTDGGSGTDVIVSSIVGTYSGGVTLLVDRTTITNTARIGGTTAGAVGITVPSASSWILTNLGSIDETGTNSDGISVVGVSTIVGGIGAQDAIINGASGRIIAQRYGIVLNANGSVTNQSGGTIQGATGVFISAGTPTGGITIGDGVYPVYSQTLAAAASITNQLGGVILGTVGVYAVTAATVVNYGSIGTAYSTFGIALAAGGPVTNHAGGTIRGDVGISAAAAASVVNAGQIDTNGVSGDYAVELRAGGSVINQAGGTITGVYAAGAVTMANAGVIQSTGLGGDNAINLHMGGTITNQLDGVILGRTGILSGTAVTVDNYGTVGGLATSFGVYLQAGGTVTNQSGGTIAGGAYAVFFNHGFTGRLAIAPGSTLIGEANGGNASGTTAIGTLELTSGASAGTLSGLGTKYVNFVQTTIDAGANWTFSGANTIAASATVTDAGTMTDTGALVVGGTLTGNEFYLSGGSLTNQTGGLVSSTNIHGFGNDTVVNQGTIESSLNSAIYLAGAGNVSNLGTAALIEGFGGVLIATGGTITNAGTIASNQGTSGVAVHFNNGDARLTDDPGAVFIGSIFGGTGGTAVLELASGASAGTIAGLGGSVTNFTSLAFDNGAAWTVIGNDATAGLGTLGITGFAVGDTIDLTGFTAVSRAFASNSLVLTNLGGSHEALAIEGAFATDNFRIVGDGDGGTDVIFQSPPAIAAGGTVTFIGGGSPVVLDSTLNLTDPTSLTLASGTVSVGSGFRAGDTLNFINQNSIAGTFDAGTGVLTLSGVATVADYQAALDSISYGFTPGDGDPTGGADTSRVIAWTVNDGTASSDPGASTLDVTHVAPVLTTAGTVSFSGGGAPVALDATLSLSDPDSGGLLNGGTVSIAGFVAGDILSADTTGVAITGSYNTLTGVLTLSGIDTLADYQAVLRGVEYSFNPADGDPTAGGGHISRTIDWSINDGVTSSATGTSTLTVAHVSPTVTAGGTATFDGGGAAVVLDSGIVVTDPDSGGDLTGATIVIGNGYASAVDDLLFTTQNGITGVFNSTNGTLVLSGTAPIADYESALASIAYDVRSAGDDPTNGGGDTSRTIDWTIDDGVAVSATGTSTLSVVHVAPTVTAGATVSFTGGGLVVALDGAIVVTDPDSGGELTGATISVASGFLPGDTLNFGDQNGIVGDYDVSTGVLTLSGTATIANYQSALASITYGLIPGDGDPTGGGAGTSRAIDWLVSDGVANSAIAASTLNVVHVAPTVTAGATVSFIGGGAAVALDSAIIVNDPDSGGDLTGATIVIGNGHASAVDDLLFTTQNGIAGVFNSTNGTLVLSGTASIADYETALASVTYDVRSVGEDPTNGGGDTSRTISWSVNDGVAGSGIVTSTLNTVHVAPAIVAGGTVSFTGGGAAVVLDGSIVVADPDSGGNLTSATISLASGFVLGDTLNFVDQNNIVGNYNAATGTLTLSGVASVAGYQAALQSVTGGFSPIDGDPTNGGGDTSRTIHWLVGDGTASSNIGTSTLHDVHAAPTIAASGSVTYTIGEAAVLLDGGAAIADPDSGGNLSGGTISVSGGFLAGDMLNFTDQNNITGSYDGADGVLTLSGVATVADYQTALDSVTYSSGASDPTSGGGDASRTISWSVSDGVAAGTATTGLAVVFSPPVIAGTVSGQTTTDEAAVSPFPGVAISDAVVGQTETVIVTLSNHANGVLSNLGGGAFDSSTGVFTITGNDATVSSAVDGLLFTPVPHQVVPGASVTTTFTIEVTDSAGSISDSATTVGVTAVNDAPTITGAVANQGVPNQTPGNPFATVTIADPDPGAIETATVTLSAPGNGTLSNLSTGAYDAATGVYSVTGTPTADTAAIQALVFTPIAQPGIDVVTTGFAISPGAGGVADTTTSVTSVQQILGLAAVPLDRIAISVSPDGSGFAAALDGMTNEAVVTDPVEGGTYTVPTGYQALFAGGTADVTLSDAAVGDALLVANQGNDELIANAANDVLVAGSGNDSLVGGSFASTVVGGAGASTVFAGSGAMRVIEGAGPISFGGNSNAGSTVSGGTGPDASPLTATLTGANQTASVGSSAATITASGSGDAVIGGSSTLNATLSGSANTVQAGTGSSTIASGGAGNLVIGSSVSGGGALLVTETGSNDTIAGGANPTTVNASTGTGTSVAGGAGSLTFVGGVGTSTVLGGTGATSITAGAGGVVFNVGASNNATVNSGGGTATIFGAAGAIVNLTGSAGGSASQPDYVVAGSGSETLNASGSAAAVWLSVNTTVSGAAATMIAGSGNDTLVAGSAPGSTTMTGGIGSDAFVFFRQAVGGARDVINDFTGSDGVYIEGYGPGSAGALQAGATVGAAGLTLTLSDGTTITFSNLTNATALDGKMQYG